ncbi:MAG: DUF4870 domain-containing protein [Sedimentisphaerales bacterium]|nr:DUF4870 domain-containing protein [Sedimentisphaerales bacterium]
MADNFENPQNSDEQKEPGTKTAPEPSPASVQTETSRNARDLAMLCHLLGIIGFFAPLVIWLNEKDKHEFVNQHGRAAMNYQISILIYYVAAWLLCFILIGFFVLIGLAIIHIVFVIMGAVKASKGMPWQYPIAIRFLK